MTASVRVWPEETTLDSYREAGYVVVRNALSARDVEHYLAAADELTTRLRQQENFPAEHMESEQSVRIRNTVGLDARLATLIDHPSTFPLLLDIIGPYLRLVGSEMFVRDAAPTPMVPFHTDGGPAMQMVSVDHAARALQVKIQFFLTDVSEEDSGNFTLVRGSHRVLPSETRFGCHIPEANTYLDAGSVPPDTTQLRAAPGDAVIFPYSLWHAVAPNVSGRARKSVILRYGHLWHQPFDYADVDGEVLARMTERQRRLVGDLGPDAGPKAWYKPSRSMPASCRIRQTVGWAMWWPRRASSPWIRRWPHRGFSLASRSTSDVVLARVRGRPVRRAEWTHLRPRGCGARRAGCPA